MFVKFVALTLLLAPCVYAAESSAPAPAADTPFSQETHKAYPISSDKNANDVRSVAVDHHDNVWVATKAGAYVLKKGETKWTPMMSQTEAGPTFNVTVAPNDVVWIGAWNGLYRATLTGLTKVQGIEKPVSAIGVAKDGVIALGPDGMWRVGPNDQVKAEPLPCARGIRNVLVDPDGSLWISTGMGLYHHTASGNKRIHHSKDIIAADVHGAAYSADGRLWVAGLGGVTVYDHKDGSHQEVKPLTEAPEGSVAEAASSGQPQPAALPGYIAQCVVRGPDGRMWVGLNNGLTRYDARIGSLQDEQAWSYRAAPRWLVNDDVRDVAFDSAGTAWIATAGGVSAIAHTEMTLAQKAQYYLNICLARHVRPPGLVEKCLLKVPGDVNTWAPRDDDNDGQYTGMYLAMQSFRYAVTKDPQAKANAKHAYDALQFLQTVTDTPGFVARSVIPVSWTRMNDRNEVISPKEWADRHVNDPRDKYVPKHWRPAKDGKWFWKDDTSSDEITGHFYGYLMYYDLVADAAERAVVRKHVRKIMDYIINGGYVLKDIDGKHTHWGVWAPKYLNHDPDWQDERGINSVEILSYLLATYHMTGDQKYLKDYHHLLYDEHYDDNVRHAKIYNPASRTHIDDELLAIAYPALLIYEKDPKLEKLYRESLDWWYKGVAKDQSPFFNFTYAALSHQRDPHLDQSLGFLRDSPLDLVRWTIDNSKREDLRLVRAPEIEPLQTSRMLPASERFTIRWDENPWSAVNGSGGRMESSGVYWMLPYWMGRYYGLIK